MSVDATKELLNRLLILHARTLPVYLLDAAPWFRPGNEHALEVLRDIANDQQDTATRIADLLMERNYRPDMGDFPLMFTSFNDLSVDYLVQEMLRRQTAESSDIADCVAKLAHDPAAKALAEEALGAAKAHLDSLRDLAAEPAHA